jgi:hypothetical protein
LILLRAFELLELNGHCCVIEDVILRELWTANLDIYGSIILGIDYNAEYPSEVVVLVWSMPSLQCSVGFSA